MIGGGILYLKIEFVCNLLSSVSFCLLVVLRIKDDIVDF